MKQDLFNQYSINIHKFVFSNIIFDSDAFLLIIIINMKLNYITIIHKKININFNTIISVFDFFVVASCFCRCWLHFLFKSNIKMPI